MELRVARKFRVGPKIGSGSFGEIYAVGFFIICAFNQIFLLQFKLILSEFGRMRT